MRIKYKDAQKMNLKSIAILMAGHPLRGSINDTSGGEVAVVQMKDVDLESGLQKDQCYRINLTGRKKPDYLKLGDILFVGRGYRIWALPDFVGWSLHIVLGIPK